MKPFAPMKMLALGTVTAAVILVSSQASARTTLVHGSVCQPVQGSGGCIEYSNYGVHNICSGTATVECPFPTDERNSSPLPNVYQVYYTAYDRHTSSNINCTIQKVGFDGNASYSAPANTGGGGVGSGIQSPIVFPNVSQDGWWRMRCTIPGVQTAGWFSHITNILVGTDE